LIAFENEYVKIVYNHACGSKCAGHCPNICFLPPAYQGHIKDFSRIHEHGIPFVLLNHVNKKLWPDIKRTFEE